MHYVVLRSHRSEFPEPIILYRNDIFRIGEMYMGSQDWDNWFFCEKPGEKGGWVPGQLIMQLPDGHGKALEDYCANELDVDEGDMLQGVRLLNGWMWCVHLLRQEEGWVPMDCLQLVQGV